jgi:hypothetical protein
LRKRVMPYVQDRGGWDHEQALPGYGR